MASKMNNADFIIVGSGCSGSMAAQTLVNGGARVLMLDVGASDEQYAGSIPNKDFESIRIKDKNQHEYFLGKKFESLEINESGSGAQITPARKHIIKYVDEYLKFASASFAPVESLAYGGLGAAWGLGCCVYSSQEMNAIGLNESEINSAYEIIAERIGISADKDDAHPYTSGKIKTILPGLNLDANAKKLFENYLLKRKLLNEKRFYIGRPALALLSQDYKGRKASKYDDMHFYHDTGDSAYRPWLTIDALKKKSNFCYEKNQFVVSFAEENDGVTVNTFDIFTKEFKTFSAKKLILAAGALSTARIIMRTKNTEKEISFLCNPYTYYPCLQWNMIGKKIEQYKTGMAQLAIFHDPYATNFNVAMASLYTYRSLFLFRLLNEVPLNFKDGKEIMRFLLSGIVIMGIHHPDSFSDAGITSSSSRFIKRIKDSTTLTNDSFKIEYALSQEERIKIIAREKLFISSLKKLGATALKRVEPAMGASIHYAGTLPFSKVEKEFSLDYDGRLHGAKNVFVADSSGFNYLPAKGLTLTLMANAHNVAAKLIT